MHTGPIPESAGEFQGQQKTDDKCRRCQKQDVTYRVWESSDGAYEDEKYTCGACGYVWWVDGIDS